jgi:hypothetical protein
MLAGNNATCIDRGCRPFNFLLFVLGRRVDADAAVADLEKRYPEKNAYGIARCPQSDVLR